MYIPPPTRAIFWIVDNILLILLILCFGSCDIVGAEYLQPFHHIWDELGLKIFNPYTLLNNPSTLR